MVNPLAGFNQVNVGYGIAMSQNGHHHLSYFGDIGGPSWTTYTHTALTSASFVEVFNSGSILTATIVPILTLPSRGLPSSLVAWL